MSKTKPETAAQRPAWFDETKHSLATGGIFETATGVLLDADGQPQSSAVRQMRAQTPAA